MPSRDNPSVAASHHKGKTPTNMPPGSVDYDERDQSAVDVVPTSPYVDSEIVSIDVGDSATRFLVHSLMLHKSAPLFALASKEQPISLRKLDEGPAHTLVHHLYAGKFETNFHYAPVGKFRHSTCVYCAAVQYQLPSLAELSKDKIIEAGERLPIFDILRVARDQAFPLLPETDVWYSQYLEDVIQKAMAQDPEPFRKPDFITRVEGNSRLLQIVWKTVMSTYATTSAPASVKESGAETPLAESMITESEAPTQSSQHQLPSPTESVVDSPPTSRAADDLIEPQPLDLEASVAAKPEVQSQAQVEDNANEAVTDIGFNDDFGLPAIEPTTLQSQVEALQVDEKSVKDIEKPQHVRADSFIDEDAIALDANFEDAARKAVGEAGPTVSNVNLETSKKSKKKNKKKSSIVF